MEINCSIVPSIDELCVIFGRSSSCTSKLRRGLQISSLIGKLTFLWIVIERQWAGIWHWSAVCALLFGEFRGKRRTFSFWQAFVDDGREGQQTFIETPRKEIPQQRYGGRDNITHIWSAKNVRRQKRWIFDSLSAKNDRSRNDLSTLRYLSIQAEGTGPENNEYAPVMRLNANFLCRRPADGQYLASWWALLTFENIILNVHCIQKSIYELIS